MKYGSIAGGDKTTVESALDILKCGGNAFDAAVGAVFTSMVSEFTLTGPGGGGALLAYPAGETPILFDFFVDTPPPQPNKKLDFFGILIDFGPATQKFHIGQGSVAVPGNTAGLLRVHERLGRIPLKTVLEPAIDIAKSGIILNKAHGYLMKMLDPILSHTSAGQKLFNPKGNVLKEGDRFQNPAFADFLEGLISDGADFFYKGDGSKLILGTVGEKGLLTKESLESYRVVERTPLKSNFHGKTLYTNPIPSLGGTLITFTLQLLERSNTASDTELLHLINSMRLTASVREKTADNPNKNYQISDILEDKNMGQYFDQFLSMDLDNKTENDPPSRGATTQVSVIDREGNAASITTTNGEGCGYLIPELGIMLNNMLGEEDLNPSGFHNFVKQMRLPTMMAPSLILGRAGPELALGSGGSNRIRSAIIQVILNYLTKGMNLKESVEAPRIHLEGSTLHFEPFAPIPNKIFLPEYIQFLKWDNQNLFFGGVNAVTLTEAVGDSRRGGAGCIY